MRASISIITVDAAFLGLHDVFFDLDTLSSIALGGGTTIAGSSTMFTVSSALANIDGLSIPLSGQPIPDTLDAPLSVPLQTNTAAGSIVALVGLDRKLTLNISIPFTLDLNGTIVSGTAAGAIVALATVPEPATFAPGAMGLIGLVAVAVRRRRGRRE